MHSINSIHCIFITRAIFISTWIKSSPATSGLITLEDITNTKALVSIMVNWSIMPPDLA